MERKNQRARRGREIEVSGRERRTWSLEVKGRKTALKKPPESVSTNQSQQIRETTTTALSSEANSGLVYNNKDLFISPLLPKHPLSIPLTSDPVFVILQSLCSSFQPLTTLKKHFLTKFVCHVPARRHGRLKHANIKATSEQPHFTLNLFFIPRANTLKLYSL